jgi:hypothetical protein
MHSAEWNYSDFKCTIIVTSNPFEPLLIKIGLLTSEHDLTITKYINLKEEQSNILRFITILVIYAIDEVLIIC